jgi:capsular exopolysaccharide synthesis family protein
MPVHPAGEPEKNGAGQGSSTGQGHSHNAAHGVNGTSHQASGATLARYENEGDEANGNLSLNDPRTRLLMEQLINVMLQDNKRPSEDKGTQRHFDLAAALSIMRRRWPVMLGVFMLITAAVAYKLRPGKTSYVATATVLLPKQDQTKMPDIFAQQNSEISSNVQTQTAIITSPPLVEWAWKKVPEELRLKGWPLGRPPHQAVRAAAPVSSDLVDITVTALDPEAAKMMANNLVAVYRQRMIEWSRSATTDKIATAEKQVKQAQDLYLKAKRELQDFQQKTGVIDIGSKLTTVNQRIQELQVAAEAASIEAASGLSSEKVLGDVVVAELQKKANDARATYQTVSARYQPSSPEAQRARQALTDAEQLLSSRQNALLSQNNQKATQLSAQLAAARSESAALPPIASRFNELSTNAELLGKTYESLRDRRTALELSEEVTVSTAKMVNPATTAIPTGRTWSRVILMAVLCGLVLSILAGVLAEQLDNTVHSPDELESLVNAPVLGSLPMFGDEVERRLAFAMPSKPVNASANGQSTQLAHASSALDNARSSAARPLLEACRILRSNVNFSMMDAPLRSILVTSADPGEGKSMCALNLATVMAYDGKRVILLDCDLRRPTQHRLCSSATNKVPMRPGFVDVLAGSVAIEEALRPTPVENLKVMASGTLPPNPPELLSSQAGQRLLAELRDSCDLLVIDSPPLMFLTDSQVLASFVDGAILVVAASQTARGHVQRAHSVLRNAGGRVLGVIFNKVKAHNDPDAYYGSYYSYYASSPEEDGGDWSPTRGQKKERRSEHAESRAEEKEEVSL